MLGVLPRPGLSRANEVLRSKGLKDGKSRLGDLVGDEETAGSGLDDLVPSELEVCRWFIGRAYPDFGGDAGGVGSSGSTLERSSPAWESLDIPGSLIPRLENVGAMSKSASFLRYAADPIPLSAVWRNHVGSFAPSAAAISFLDFSSSVPP